MNQITIKVPSQFIIAQIFLLAVFYPAAASAHFIDPNTPAQFIAAVGADGHDHEHVVPVPAVTSAVSGDGHTDHSHEPMPVMAVDGHTDHAHSSGESSILLPGTALWFVVLAVSILLMSLLSYWVWRYLQVAPIKPAEVVVDTDKK